VLWPMFLIMYTLMLRFA